MDPCAVSGSLSRPRSLVNVIVVVIWIVTISGLVRVVGIIADHHVFSPGQRWGQGNLFLGVVGWAAPARRRLRSGAVTVMLAMLASPDEPLQWLRQVSCVARTRRGPGGLLPLLPLLLRGHRRVRGVLNDGEGSRLHLFLGCALAPRRLILRALAQNAEDLAIVGPLQCLPERTLSLVRPHIPLGLGSLNNENQEIHARECVKRRARYA